MVRPEKKSRKLPDRWRKDVMLPCPKCDCSPLDGPMPSVPGEGQSRGDQRRLYGDSKDTIRRSRKNCLPTGWIGGDLHAPLERRSYYSASSLRKQRKANGSLVQRVHNISCNYRRAAVWMVSLRELWIWRWRLCSTFSLIPTRRP